MNPVKTTIGLILTMFLVMTMSYGVIIMSPWLIHSFIRRRIK